MTDLVIQAETSDVAQLMAAERLKGMYFPVLDHGFVALVDYMGGDADVVRAARVSYGAGTRKYTEDRGLLRYLMRHAHTTPFEMVELKFHVKLPIFVARQLIRHRTACLTGATMLHFDLPGGIERRGNQLYKMSIADVYKKFGKDERISGMHLRNINEETKSVQHTHIVDIWESGEKDVYRVEMEDGSSAVMSEMHLCFTTKGWLTLREVVLGLDARYSGEMMPACAAGTFDNVGIYTVGPGRDTGVVPQFNEIDEATEQWAAIVGWEDYYEVSDQGRVRRTVGGKGSRSFGRTKKLTVSGSRAVVSLNRPGHQVVEQVHQLMLEAFVGKAEPGQLGRHKDGNGLNNRLENLVWSTQQENADDRVRDGATTRLRSAASRILSVEHIGKEMTYDLEVEGPWHNFAAGGMVVHNSVNEYSMRYSLAPMQFYNPSPTELGSQSKKNKQGRGEPISDQHSAMYLRAYKRMQEASAELYEAVIAPEVDLARELARMHLPLSLYTEWYWKIDLKNCLDFLKLRVDKHAQWEIQETARVKAGIARVLAPLAFEAWVDYKYQSRTFSRMEMKLLSSYFVSKHTPNDGIARLTSGNHQLFETQAIAAGLSKREWDELLAAFDPATSWEPEVFDLNYDSAKTAQYFADEAAKYVPKVDQK